MLSGRPEQCRHIVLALFEIPRLVVCWARRLGSRRDLEFCRQLEVRMEQNLRSADHSQAASATTALALLTIVLLLVRLWLDAHLELMFDEAYYALWARNLAWGYLDHPPMVAVWIRLSTLLFGNNEFGIRVLGTFAAAAGGGLVYLLSKHLFANRAEAAFAGLLYSAMLLIAAGSIIITPDTPLLFFWSIACYALVRMYRDGDWRWWLLVGAATGLALQSKYTALLLGAGIACAMLVVPPMRRWWRHPAPYVAGVSALAIFSPVVVWNYRHGWASFAKQFGRVQPSDIGIRYVGEFFGSQLGLLTPFVFILTIGGIWGAFRRPSDERREASLFLVALIAPMLAYFLFHTLHARVHGNWVAPAYPLVAVLAANAAFHASEFPARWRPAMALSRRYAVPVGIGFALFAYVQAVAGVLPINPAKDPTALMVGWSGLGRRGWGHRTARARELHSDVWICLDELAGSVRGGEAAHRPVQRTLALAIVRPAGGFRLSWPRLVRKRD